MGLPEKILDKVDNVLTGQRDIKKKLLDQEMNFFGRMAELPVLGQTIRAMTRPILSWFVALLFGTGQVLYWIYIWKYKVPMPEFLPDALVTVFKWVIGFWFGSRGLQETVKILTKTSRAKREDQKVDLKTLKQQRKMEMKEAKLRKKGKI